MKKTNVYWATKPHTLQHLCDYGLEPLVTAIKGDPFFSQLVRCPSLISTIKNTYLIRTPYSILFERDRNANVIRVSPYSKNQQSYTQRDRWVCVDGDQPVQMHEFYGYNFFSDQPANLTMTPPYLHANTYPGAAGTYDISKWFRLLSPAFTLPDSIDKLIVNAGEPCLYIKFDCPVNLVQFNATTYTEQVNDMTGSFKQIQSNTPLRTLYDMFTRNKIHKNLLREIKRNLCDEE
jgi:hypothetical protein